MDDFNIISCYKKGYSIKRIIKMYYKSKNKNLKKEFNGSSYIIPKPEYSYTFCSNYIYDVIMKYIQNYNSSVV